MVFSSQVATDSPSTRLRLLTQCLMRHSQVSPAQQAEATQPDLIAWGAIDRIEVYWILEVRCLGEFTICIYVYTYNYINLYY